MQTEYMILVGAMAAAVLAVGLASLRITRKTIADRLDPKIRAAWAAQDELEGSTLLAEPDLTIAVYDASAYVRGLQAARRALLGSMLHPPEVEALRARMGASPEQYDVIVDGGRVHDALNDKGPFKHAPTTFDGVRLDGGGHELPPRGATVPGLKPVSEPDPPAPPRIPPPDYRQ